MLEKVAAQVGIGWFFYFKFSLLFQLFIRLFQAFWTAAALKALIIATKLY